MSTPTTPTTPRITEATMDVPIWRLHLLRATYLLISIGLALTFGPDLLSPAPDWALRQGSTAALLAALACRHGQPGAGVEPGQALAVRA